MLGAGLLFPAKQRAADSALVVAGQPVEIRITPVSEHTFRLSVLPLKDGEPVAVPTDGSLVQASLGGRAGAKVRDLRPQVIRAGDHRIRLRADRLAFDVEAANGVRIQRFEIDRNTGALSFSSGDAPLLGLGEGGPQFDRRGSMDQMRSGQGGFELATHGGRVPIPWVIGTGGWAMYIHHPFGRFDLREAECRFVPAGPESALPLDLFFVVSREPAVIMAEYARLTGHPELPPLWSLGYQQSHRTLASREEILEEAKTFRRKKLPCDTMIYLGTGFCPSGWNTGHGEFEFNRNVFPDPKVIFDQLHDDHFRVVLHVVVRSRSMHGTVRDACNPNQPVEEQPSCYWARHRDTFALGVDGWWPDEGDPFNIESRLTRNRMYWEAPQLDRPNERPFALHRNGYAGMQRYAAFLWSGDVVSRWETLQTHLPAAINVGLSGIPFWGTDIGGFVPSKELDGELYVRWFQFASFCPLFRSHGRTWKLRLPWGWNTGDAGPVESPAVPDASELHNEQVEPICRKYLELRYRLLPYLYSAVRESTLTGMPIMRALWLHYPDDPVAVARGDEYLWGRDLLVAPVVEKGATSRRLYLPRGTWFDYWTGESETGGREIERTVDLQTTPIYVRAGSIVPMDPVRQYTSQAIDQPTTISIYPGADAAFLLYEDDGKSFNYRRGEWTGIQMAWSDSKRLLTLRLANGSRMLSGTCQFEGRLGLDSRTVSFTGRPVELRF